MQLKLWRFIALILTALTLGMGFCHLMEMPARMTWDQTLWVGATVQGGLYRMFGSVGALIDLAAIVTAFVVAYLVRRRREVFRLNLYGAILYLIALLLWAAIVFPANLDLATWLTGPVPADWASVRMRWETGHAIGCIIQLVGFSFLLLSVLADTPPRQRHIVG
jgi:hypothetical protein